MFTRIVRIMGSALEGSRLFHALKKQAQGLFRNPDTTACGFMLGAASFFIMASAQEGLWFQALTLTIFVVAALIFHASNIEPFKKYTDRSHGSGLEDLLTTFRFGIYTALGAGTILLLAVLPAVLQSRSLKEFAPWIPLFITVYSLSTVTIHKLQLPPPHEGVALADFSGVSVNVFSDTSTRVVSSIGSGTRTPSESHRHDALYFRELGPSSRTSHRTGSGDSEISLPFMAGQPPPHWDSLTRSLFASEHAHTEAYLPQDPLPRIDGYPGFANDMASEHSSLGSCHRLLEAY